MKLTKRQRLLNTLRRFGLAEILLGLFVIVAAVFSNLDWWQLCLLFGAFAGIVQFVRQMSHAANKALMKGDYLKALELCQKSIASGTNDAQTHTIASLALLNLCRYEEALEQGNQALIFARNYPYAYNALAWAEINRENAAIGVDYANKAIAIKPLSDFFITRAVAYIQLFKFDLAIADCNTCLSRQPHNSYALGYRSIAHCEKYELEEGLRDAVYAIEVCKNKTPTVMSDLLTWRGYAHAAQNNFPEAIADCSAALDLNPNHTTALLGRAFYSIVVRNLNQSISDLDSLAIKAQHPLFIPFVLSNRSLILFVEGDLPNALAKSQEAVDCSPNSPSILTIYAKHLLSNGRSEEALVNLDRALSLNPFEREAYYFRHEVHEAMGNKELAEADKKIALDYGYRPYL